MAEMSVAAPPSLTLVCGVMASGKSTVGLQLASHWGAVFHDADAFHDAENVAKMTRGEPLTDADRAPWLRRLRVDAIDAELAAGRRVVLACSALRRSYRCVLVDGLGCSILVVHATAPVAVLRQRAATRAHFMPASLLDSQLGAWEPLDTLPAHVPVVTLDTSVDDAVEQFLATR